ncbi:hypothetical protein PsYK624_019260 [Phanerochaete sordida]|uniref:Uncharacterized protein n=1 Tax=Phanerochaete sordida TaxID=48140 RepID=A0A9P3G0G8_9APHY|nr:hypothetical protein PsYK624_019260 [Phanerochaete sordida]
MSSSPQHIRFVDPLPSPPADRPRKLGIRYPSVAQRKDVPDRLSSPDLVWPSQHRLSRTNLSLTPLATPPEMTSIPPYVGWEEDSCPGLTREMIAIQAAWRKLDEQWDARPEPEKPRASGSLSDSLRGLLSLARGSLLSASRSRSSLDEEGGSRPRLYLHCRADGQESPETASPSSTVCESSSSADSSPRHTPALEIRRAWLAGAQEVGGAHA